jgi:hypothetical protein
MFFLLMAPQWQRYIPTDRQLIGGDVGCHAEAGVAEYLNYLGRRQRDEDRETKTKSIICLI